MELVDQKEKSNTQSGNDPIAQKCEADNWAKSKSLFERRPIQRVIGVVRRLGNQNNVVSSFEYMGSYLQEQCQ